MQDHTLKQAITYANIARRVKPDPDNTLFYAMDPQEQALVALGLTLIRAMYPELRESALDAHEKLVDLSEVQKEKWRRGRREAA